MFLSKKIKIFVDAHCLDTSYQGTQTFVRDLYLVLLSHYHDLDIYFGASNKENVLKNFPFLDSNKILIYKKSIFPLQRILVDIPRILKQQHFDFAHFQNLAPLNVKGTKSIVTLHDVLYNDYKEHFPFHFQKSRSLLFGLSIKNAFIKTTVSNYSLRRIAYHYKISPKEITIISNAVNELDCHFKTKSEAEELIENKFGLKRFILYVSRFEPRKNHELLLDSYLEQKLYERDIHLVFIGEKSIEINSLDNKLSGLQSNIKQYIHHFHQVDGKDLSAFYTACSLFVYPSDAEGFGIPPLEAAICKAPVLCSSNTAMGEFDFFAPNHFQPCCKKELGIKIKGLIDNPPSVTFLNDTARAVKEKYSWQKSADTFYKILKNSMEA